MLQLHLSSQIYLYSYLIIFNSNNVSLKVYLFIIFYLGNFQFQVFFYVGSYFLKDVYLVTLCPPTQYVRHFKKKNHDMSAITKCPPLFKNFVTKCPPSRHARHLLEENPSHYVLLYKSSVYPPKSLTIGLPP